MGKKSDGGTAVAKKTMADVWKEMEKQHGDEGLYAGDSDMITYSNVISTGSLVLDDALGIWGVPRGHIVQYAGFESSGKTLLSLSTIAQWQKQNPENWALFIDAEFSFQADWAESLGVDTSRLLVYRENKAAKIFDFLVGVPMKPDKKGVVNKSKLGILDKELEVGGTGLGVIVIDSVAAMQPPAEEASVAGKANIALMARFLPPELRKITPLLTATEVTLIMINQLRFKPDVMYGDPTDSPGGKTLKHACSQMINLGMMTGKDHKVEEGGEQVGHMIRAKVQKNKKAPPFRVAEFTIKYTEGIVDRNVELRDLAAKYGIIEKPNTKTWILDGVKYNGKTAMAEALLNEEVQADLLERVKEAKKMSNETKNNTIDEQNDDEGEDDAIDM